MVSGKEGGTPKKEFLFFTMLIPNHPTEEMFFIKSNFHYKINQFKTIP